MQFRLLTYSVCSIIASSPKYTSVFTISVVDIGKVFDNRDHSTVLYSIQRVEDKMKRDPAYAERIKEIKTNISSKR